MENLKTTELQVERLDYFSKILVATSAINYMARIVSMVNQDIKFVIHHNPDVAHIHRPPMDEREKIMLNAVKKLAEIMEEMGECINAHDCLTGIDTDITSAAFEIIVHGKDDTDGFKDQLA